MLRIQGVPTKKVDGYQEFIGAHSWNEVLINGQWVHMMLQMDIYMEW